MVIDYNPCILTRVSSLGMTVIALMVLGCDNQHRSSIVSAPKSQDEVRRLLDELSVTSPQPIERTRLEEPGYMDWHRTHVRDVKRNRATLIGELFAIDPDPDRHAKLLAERWIILAGLLDEHELAIETTQSFINEFAQHKMAKEAWYCQSLAMVRQQLQRAKRGRGPDNSAVQVCLENLIQFSRKHPSDDRILGVIELLGDACVSAGSDLQIRIYEEGLELASDENSDTWRHKLRLANTVGKPFELEFTDAISGKAISTKQLIGNVVVIDIWASWCGPCVEDVPLVKRWIQDYQDDGLEILGCTLDDDVDVLRSCVQKHQIPWPQYFQGKDWPWTSSWGITEIPVLLIIDRHGNLRYIERLGAKLAEKRILELLTK